MARRKKRHTLPRHDPLHDLPTIEYEFKRRSRRDYHVIKGQFTKVRSDFLHHLTENHLPALKKIGLTHDEISAMREGIVPENFAVHHIRPLDSTGGTNDFDNLILIPQKPYHEDIHAYLAPQIGGLKVSRARTVRLPLPQGPVFRPAPDELSAFVAARRDTWRAQRREPAMPQSLSGTMPAALINRPPGQSPMSLTA